MRWEPTSCSKTSSPHFPGVGGCWPRGSWPPWHGQALPCLQLVPLRGEGVPGPLPVPRQHQRCMGRQGAGWQTCSRPAAQGLFLPACQGGRVDVSVNKQILRQV